MKQNSICFSIIAPLIVTTFLIGCTESNEKKDIKQNNTSHVEEKKTPVVVKEPSSSKEVASIKAKRTKQENTISDVDPATGITAELNKTHKPRNNIETARNSTVFIDTGFGTGSGFFINDSCTVVTNHHVIQLDFNQMREMDRDIRNITAMLKQGVSDSETRKNFINQLEELKEANNAYLANGLPKKLTLTLVNDREIEAKIAAVSREEDLAYLQIKEDGCTPLKASTEANFPLGTQVYTIGNPAGQKYSVTSGIISSYQIVEGKSYVQTDAAINPGNSGGPLIDKDGKVIGVNSFILTHTQGIGFAIPITRVNDDYTALSKDLKKFRESGVFTLWDLEKEKTESAEDKKIKARLEKNAVTNCVKAFNDEKWVDALRECAIGADYNNPQAQFLLAELQYNEDDKDSAKTAVELYKQSSANNYAEATFRLANFRYTGTPFITKNIPLAIELYNEACDVKLAEACLMLGDIKEKRFDYKVAMDYYKKAEEYGNRLALYQIGRMYEAGFGVEANKETALEFYNKAAMLGDNRAHYQLCWLYYKGIGVKRSYQTAYTWALVAGRDKPDDLSSWSNETPDQARFFMQKLLSKKQLNDAYIEAKNLQMKIAVKTAQHEKKYSYREKAVTLKK